MESGLVGGVDEWFDSLCEKELLSDLSVTLLSFTRSWARQHPVSIWRHSVYVPTRQLARCQNKRQEKINSGRAASMFTFTPVAHPTADTQHPLLLLQADSGERYFFGKVSEGSQRCLTENKIKISKLGNIFLTGMLDWSAIGGLPGMILTIADQGKDNLVLHHGSQILNYIVSTWRYFVFRFGINLRTNTLVPSKNIYKDKLLQVNPIVISKKHSEEVKLGNKTVESLLNDIVAHMFPKKTDTNMKYEPSRDPHLNVKLPENISVPSETTNYEVQFNSIRGRFKVEEAIRLGVPKGPLFAKLTKGESITLEDGTIVSPDQVLEKERNFGKVLILDIPDNSFIPSFMEKFKTYDLSGTAAIYYFLDDKVVFNDDIIELMETLNHGNVQHLISHSKISPNSLNFRGSALTTLKLKSMQPESYNLPKCDQILSKDFFDCFEKSTPLGTTLIQTSEGDIKSSIDKENVHIFKRGTDVTLEPYTKNVELEVQDLNSKVITTELPSTADFWKRAFHNHVVPLQIPGATYENIVENQFHVNNFNSSPEKATQPEIITLGTGSALPSKYRNVISTLVKVPFNNNGVISNRNVILDAGENTIGMLKRMFNSTELLSIFKDLKLIYLSHLHADHHLGIISILREWNRYTKNDENAKIYIVTPWQYKKFVDEWLNYEDESILSRINYISCEHFIHGNYVRKEIKPLDINEFEAVISENTNKKRKLQLSLDDTSSFKDYTSIKMMCKDLKIFKFETCRAKHCDWAYSNTITFYKNSFNSDLFKVSYSGDTRPNLERFAYEIGKGSDLLIHEATLDNELIEDAIKKRHSTINEAINVSNAMEAKKLILTHFSQRYPKLPSMDNNIKVEANEFCFAFDGMIIPYNTLGKQKEVFPMLSKAFAEEQQEEEEESNDD